MRTIHNTLAGTSLVFGLDFFDTGSYCEYVTINPVRYFKNFPSEEREKYYEYFTKALMQHIMSDNALKISQFISQLDSYPPSLNKTLILGALEYVFLAQRKLDKIGKKDEECLEIVKLIREYLDIVQSKLKSKSEEFYLVSIDDAEEVFEKIENICSQKGILPKIEDENVDLSEFINGQSISTSI